MATEVSVRNITSGEQIFYSTYDDARANASDGDVISIYADLDEQIILKNLVDVYISPGTVIDVTYGRPTITDDATACVCNITGGGIIKNSDSESRVECITVSNSESVVNIECDSIEGIGVESNTIEAASINVIAAAKFSLRCNTVFNNYNTAIQISNCEDLFINAREVIAGTIDKPNVGAPVISIEGTGTININQLTCFGYGSCFHHKGGVIGAAIGNITNLISEDSSEPTILLDGGTGEQELVLYFDEINNLNTKQGDAVKITEGKATLIGKRIFCSNGKSLDLTNSIVSAFVQCDEIISGTKGINIANSNEAVVIEANYIEGSNVNDGVIRSASGSNYVLRNAKIKNTTTSSPSIGIYIALGLTTTNQTIEIENLIIATGTTTNDFSIYRDGSLGIEIKNLGLFVKRKKSDNVTLKIGTGIEPPDGNFKYIISTDIT